MSKLLHDFSPLFRVYEDGTVERLTGTDRVPPSLNPNSLALSKDIVFFPEANLSCRLYLPNGIKSDQKLPLLVYFHGGGFCTESAFSPTYQTHLSQLVAKANVIVVSLEYRLAPEHPLPTAFEDCWTAVKWAASHINGDGSEDWLNSHADFGRMFFEGDSAGGTLAHQMAIRIGQEKLPGINNITGIILVHPYFWGKDRVGNENKILESNQPPRVLSKKLAEETWTFAYPKSSGLDDPMINPATDPKLASLGCKRVLVIVAGKDIVRDRGWYYYETLKGCGWNGEVEIMEAEEEDHVFHLFKPNCENSAAMIKRVASFINPVING